MALSLTYLVIEEDIQPATCQYTASNDTRMIIARTGGWLSTLVRMLLLVHDFSLPATISASKGVEAVSKDVTV